MAQTFKVVTSDFFGFLYDDYLNNFMALAVSTPFKYYSMRSDTLKERKKLVVKQVYETYYKLLTTGKVNRNFPLDKLVPQCP